MSMCSKYIFPCLVKIILPFLNAKWIKGSGSGVFFSSCLNALLMFYPNMPKAAHSNTFPCFNLFVGFTGVSVPNSSSRADNRDIIAVIYLFNPEQNKPLSLSSGVKSAAKMFVDGLHANRLHKLT